MILHWLPGIEDFRSRLSAAAGLEDQTARLSALADISGHCLDALQTMQLDRKTSQSSGRLPEGWTRVRLAVLASHTVEHLLPAIRVAGLRRKLLVETYVCGYGQYRQELADPGSGLHRFAPGFVLFSLSADGLLSAAAPAHAAAAMVEEARGLWSQARSALKATVIHQTLVDVSEPVFGHFDRVVESSPASSVATANALTVEAARQDSILILDMDRLAARDGIEAWFDIAHWYASKLQLAPRAAPLYGDHVMRIVAGRLGLSKKCLVLDLDNTVWGGVVGDDGINGLVLGQGSAQGEAHLALQRYAKRLRDRGIILAVCSKNEPATAREAFASHPEMHLKLEDIAVFVANWNDKAENLRDIAARLNIGLDSLVFVDDNPVERQRIRAALPMVGVPELPEDVAGYVRCIAAAGYFEATSFTQDDRQRAAQYAANDAREALRSSAQSMDEFLGSLGMIMHFGRVSGVDLARAAQLINKTNQFNVTVRRHSEEAVAGLVGNPAVFAFQSRLIDRFGDNGVISVIILTPTDDHSLQLDTWVMSCRVFGRGVEMQIMNAVVDAVREKGFRRICVEHMHTAKNGLIRDLLPKLGFREQEHRRVPESSFWSLDLARYERIPTHVRMEATP